MRRILVLLTVMALMVAMLAATAAPAFAPEPARLTQPPSYSQPAVVSTPNHYNLIVLGDRAYIFPCFPLTLDSDYTCTSD